MVKYNLNPGYTALANAKTKEGKAAISKYIQITSQIIVKYGKETDDWPIEILNEILKAAREAYDSENLAARMQKARETGGVTLADF